MNEFSIYKGLQKPLVFKGFKGKFIYWGAGFIGGGLVFGGLISSVVSGLVGIIVFVVTIFGGLYYTARQQKRGLYRKNIDKNVIIHIPNYINQLSKRNGKE